MNTIIKLSLILLVGFVFKTIGAETITITQQTSYTYQITTNNDHTFGYNIFKNNKLHIQQPTIPGIAGKSGFHKKEHAEKTAKLVISKLKKGQVPPTITAEELKSLGAI